MDQAAKLATTRAQVAANALRVSDHARGELEDEAIALAEVREALAGGRILEDYPDARRGPCCLVYGRTAAGRPLHVVCTTGPAPLVIITVYVPLPPKWPTPTERRPR